MKGPDDPRRPQGPPRGGVGPGPRHPGALHGPPRRPTTPDEWAAAMAGVPEEEREALLERHATEGPLSLPDLASLMPALVSRHCPPHIADELLYGGLDVWRVFLGSDPDTGPEEWKWANAGRAFFSLSEMEGRQFRLFLFEAGRAPTGEVVLSHEDLMLLRTDPVRETAELVAVMHDRIPPHAMTVYDGDRPIRPLSE